MGDGGGETGQPPSKGQAWTHAQGSGGLGHRLNIRFADEGRGRLPRLEPVERLSGLQEVTFKLTHQLALIPYSSFLFSIFVFPLD